MGKIAIVSDSTASISKEHLSMFNIYVNHLLVVFKNQSYRELDLTVDQFLNHCHQQKELPSTSQPAIGHTVELYESLFANGYDEIIHVTLSSQLSGSYQAAVCCAEMVDSKRIHVWDSQTVAHIQGTLAIEAARLAQKGATTSDILNVLEQMRCSNRQFTAVYDLIHLKKGGRLTNTEATLGSLLKIKPICEMQLNGKLQPIGKVRTFKNALIDLVQRTKEAHLTEDYELAVTHMANEEKAKGLCSALKLVYPDHKINIFPLSLVLGVHLGPGSVIVSWIKTR